MKSFCFKKIEFENCLHFLSILAKKQLILTLMDFNNLVYLISIKKKKKKKKERKKEKRKKNAKSSSFEFEACLPQYTCEISWDLDYRKYE